MSRYSISVPGPMAIGRGVTIENCSHGGVIASRLPASAKNAKTSPGGPGSACSRVSVWWPNTPRLRASRPGVSAGDARGVEQRLGLTRDQAELARVAAGHGDDQRVGHPVQD